MTRRTILIVDDHPLVRRGIRSLLQAQPDFHVVGEAADGMTALHLITQYQPDLMVLDIVMPGLGGLELLRELGRHTSAPKVVVLSLHDDSAYMQQAMRLGAVGYVLKHSASTFLVQAVRAALAGRSFSSCTPAREENASATDLRTSGIMDRASLLTPEERMVLRLLSRGTQDADIARHLSHPALPLTMLCRNISLKLGLTNPADLRAQASQWIRESS